MKKCNECGQSYPDAVEACPNCKTRLVEEASPQAGSGAPIAKRLLTFSAIALVYYAVACLLESTGLPEALDTYSGGTAFVCGFILSIIGGIPMGICLAQCLKGTAAKVKTVILGSILCSAIAAFAQHVCFYVKNCYAAELPFGDAVIVGYLAVFALYVMIAGIPCFLIAWLTGRILRKKSKK